MSDGVELHFDPVADGPPPRLTPTAYLALAAFAIASLLHAHAGDLYPAVLTATLGVGVYLTGWGLRVMWVAGYKAAVASLGEQLDSRVEIGNE